MEPDPAMFEQTILPHLDAAYSLARWLTGNDHDAEDIVQESCLRALKFFGTVTGKVMTRRGSAAAAARTRMSA